MSGLVTCRTLHVFEVGALPAAHKTRAATADFPHLSPSRGEASSRGFRSGRSSPHALARSRTLRGSNLRIGIRSRTRFRVLTSSPRTARRRARPSSATETCRLRPLPSPPLPSLLQARSSRSTPSPPRRCTRSRPKAADAALGELHKADRRAGNPNATSDASPPSAATDARPDGATSAPSEHANTRIAACPSRAAPVTIASAPVPGPAPQWNAMLQYYAYYSHLLSGAETPPPFPTPGATKKTNSGAPGPLTIAPRMPPLDPVAAARAWHEQCIAASPPPAQSPSPSPVPSPGCPQPSPA